MKNWTKGGEGGGMLGRGVCSLGGLMLMLMLMLAAAPCFGQGPTPPDVLPFQGSLVNGDGNPLGTPTPKNYDVVFRIWDASSGGTLLWSEQQTVTVDAGQFSVQLGLGAVHGTEPRPPLSRLMRAPDASDRYLETTVKGVGPGRADSTLLPRVRMLPLAYSMVTQFARTAETLVNSSGSAVLTISGAKIGINTTNPVTALDVAGSALVGNLDVSGDVTAMGTASAVSWTGAGAVPVGTVIMWSGDPGQCPSGWALCDGNTVNNIRTPDLRGRFVLGAGAGPGLTPRSVNEAGGAELATLGLSEMPSHSHFFDPPMQAFQSEGDHSHEIRNEASSQNGGDTKWRPVGGEKDSYYGRDWREYRVGVLETTRDRYSGRISFDGIHDHVADAGPTASASTGSGSGHSNMPPYYALAYIVRVR